MVTQEAPDSVPESGQEAAPTIGEMRGIGRDEPTLAPEPEDDPEPVAEEETPASPTFTPEQVAALEEKATSYDWITKQPDLMQVMSDFLRTKANPKAGQAPKRESGGEMDEMRNVVAQMANELELTQFLLRKPLLQGNEDALQHWAGLVKEGLNKERAFDLTKREFELRQAKQPRASRLQGSEGGHTGGGERKPTTSKYDKQIASARNAGDAVEAAMRAVMAERAASS